MFFPLRIADLKREAADAVSLAFDVPAELREHFGYRPGQYLTLRTVLDGEELRRSYSICAGLDDGELRVAIKHVPEGRFSHFANTALAPGDTIEVMPPEGRFGITIVPGAARVHVGLAAGSGITPVLSILKSVLTREPRSRFFLLYGSQSTDKILFRSELEDLKDRFLGRLSVCHVLSREEQDVAALSGRLDAERLRRLLPAMTDPAAIEAAYVCGPAGMIEVLPAALVAMGVAVARIHTERFTPSGTPRAAPAKPPAEAPFARATIVHDGKTREIDIAASETVLEAAMRAGMDLPWSCRGGMCCTCRARLAEGVVTMTENYSLEPWELEAGYVLTCQSHPTTPHVTVDYDQV